MLSEALISILRSGRSEFNQRFAEARRLYPDLDAQAFSRFLKEFVDPLACVVAREHPDHLADMVLGAYGVALELAGQKLVGPEARHQWIEELWHRVLRAAPAAVAMAPGQTIGSLTNAVHQIAATPAARPMQWIEEMERFSPSCADPAMLLRLGQVCAWRAGLAHFREGALALTNSLPESLVLSLFGVGGDESWSDVHKRMASDPWFNPAQPDRSGALRVTAQAGGFRGFGGLFVEPPRVACANNQFFVRSGSDCWLLTADLFGASFHRASLGEFAGAEQNAVTDPDLEFGSDRIIFRGCPYEISLGAIVSFASNETTLALTSEITHAVVLLALQRS